MRLARLFENRYEFPEKKAGESDQERKTDQLCRGLYWRLSKIEMIAHPSTGLLPN
jgi:hypothetical protein